MKRINKKTRLSIIAASALSIAAAAVITPIAYNTYRKDTHITNSSKYLYDGKTFNSYDDLMKYVEDNTSKNQVFDNTSHKYSINENGTTKYYDSASVLTDDASQNIKVYDGYTSLKSGTINSGKGALNELSNKVVSQMDLVPEGTQYTPDTVTVYQGRNDSIYTDEIQAKKSYLSIHDAYYYDYTYFRNASDLEQYLDQKSAVSVQNSQYFTLKDPNGSKTSLPINLTDLQKINFSDSSYLDNSGYQTVKNFVQNYAKTYVSVKDSKSNYDYFDINDKNTISNLNSYVGLDNIAYTKVYSNQNKASYVVDVSKNDDHDLTGPYIYSGGGNILSADDKNQWYKSTSAYEKSNISLINGYVENFLSILLNEDENIPESSFYYNKDGMIFYFDEVSDSNGPLSGSSLDNEWYSLVTNLKTNYYSVYQHLLSTYEQLKETKRYNAFYKLPILFTILMQGLIREEASNDIILQIRDFFTNLTKKADQTLQVINNVTSAYGLDLLENKLSTKERFSFTDLFGFANNNFDLSSNIESTLNNISEFYPNITLLMVISNIAITNNMMGIRKVDSFADSIKDGLSKFGINLSDQLKNINALSEIYDIFSGSDLATTCQILNPYNSNNLTEKTVTEMFFKTYIDNYTAAHSVSNYVKKSIAALKENNYLDIDNADVIYSLPKITHTHLYDILSSKKEITTYDITDMWILDQILTSKRISNETLLDSTSFDEIINYLSKKYSNFDYWFEYNKYSLSFLKTNSEWMSKLLSLGITTNSSSSENFSNLSDSSFRNSIKYWQSVYATYVKPFYDFYKKHKDKINSWLSGLETSSTVTSNIIDVAETGLKILGSITKCFVAAGVILTILSAVLDMFVPKTDYYSYEFTTSDGTSFSWNGGEKTTLFFGLIKTSSKTASDMDFIAPILIQDPISEDYYYCNGKKYTDITTLKTDAFKDFINNKSENVLSDSVKKVYSFAPSVDSTTNGKESGSVADSVDALAKNIIQNLQENGTASQYYSNKVYKFSNGYSNDLNAVVKNEKDKIMNEILSTKLTTLPNLDANGYPVFNKSEYDSTGNDGSTNTFVLPGNQWDALSYSTEVDSRYLKNNYLIVNPNQLVDVQANTNVQNSTTDQEAIEELTSMFLSSFEVKQKIVTKQDFINETEFSNLATKYDSYKIYQVNDDSNGSLYFMNEVDALNYYFGLNSMKLYDLTQQQYNYVFDNLTFASKNDLYAYIKNNAQEVQ